MKFVIDMNLPASWISLLEKEGWQAVHWSQVGEGNAKDSAIVAWAAENGCIILTHDLDFSRILALTSEKGPSVVQIRTPQVLPSMIGSAVISALKEHAALLETGAIMAIDIRGARIRLLPIRKS